MIVWSKAKSRGFGAPENIGKLGRITVFTYGWSKIHSDDLPYRLYTQLPGFKEEAMEKWRFNTEPECEVHAAGVLVTWLKATGLEINVQKTRNDDMVIL